jgi:hypothetical protein
MNGSPLKTEKLIRRRVHVFCGVVVVFLIVAFMAVFVHVVQAQKSRVRRVPATRKPAAPRIDYSRFSHATKKHQGECNTCHKVPTDNWKKVRAFPDVADFPGHDACVSCHRQQFFKGAKPVICSGCHSKVSPKDDARFAFRNPAAAGQFLIEFPHDRHQDVIAKLSESPGLITVAQTVSLRAWAHARRVNATQSQTNSLRYNNCEICHSPLTTTPTAPPGGWRDAFVPDAATFKDAPASHASCFNCHWKSQQPTRDNCAGCHKLADKPFKVDLAAARFSLKFRHAREQHVAECTTCHINITKSSTLRGLKPDVPITTCTECHNKDGLRQDVSKELEAIDKNRDFTCSYCHTSDIGRNDPPASHYLIAGREAMKRKDVK